DQSQAGFLIADLNNSGRLDLASWSADSFRVASAVDKRLTSLPGEEISGPFAGNQDRVATCDFDGDGDLDLLGVGGGQTVLLVNDAAAKGSWLEIGLLAQQVKGTQSAVSGRVNHYGLGSLVEIRTGAQYQSRVVRGARTHFGLGDTQQPNAVRIVWTNGIPDNVIAPAPRQYLCERQALKGSCPYLYAWNGERFGFVTDLLWGAPIGLVDPRGQLVPCREWEYLLIPGAALSPRDGEYQLSLTEELWEAAYFDQVELIAVDHPADVAVFTNEKVGPPSIAEPRLYTVRERRHPVRAEDQHGRDLLSRISQPDEVYATPFRHRRTQGFTEESTLELDLGLEARPGKVMLFLTGWLYPTDTSINAALEEQSLLTGPQPPSIQVPNATGGWREVEPFIGFPGGKTKTIAVPLSGDLFADNDYRIRLVTSMELAWDEIFFTVDETPAETREQVLPLVGAELQFRGFSDPIQHNDLGPERYDYSQVSTEPRWPPMRGWFTRYGDVTELLAAADDRSAVLGSGDEVIVRFAVPHDPPPSGWRRDFVLHNVGWDKDADLHTVYGQTVEPLPFRNMTRYPYEPNQSFPEDPDMQDYLRTYQTRTFDNRWFARFGTMQRKQ
ncbi:MAG: VCBS repeat-containing protein, partial [Planctomycetaceae bacterium]|nr:VCBS repeat-containing protein [Planctomycetaceae bacterium]